MKLTTEQIEYVFDYVAHDIKWYELQVELTITW
jgi:hypothetical protein